ncbi:unnamed protein product, partial [Coccothraustes coccothraustes]
AAAAGAAPQPPQPPRGSAAPQPRRCRSPSGTGGAAAPFGRGSQPAAERRRGRRAADPGALRPSAAAAVAGFDFGSAGSSS